MPSARLLSLLLVLGVLLIGPGCSDDGGSTPRAEPERWFAYPVSHIFVKTEGKQPGEQLQKVIQIVEALDSGQPFADVARRFSENDSTKDIGGFMGFFRPDESDLYMAVQVLPPGVISNPLDLKEGTHILLRHTHEEGMAIEKQHSIPAYGFFIPWKDREGSGRGIGREEAARRAQEAYEKVKAGTLTLPQAAPKYTPAVPPRKDAFIGNITSFGKGKPIYDELAKVGVGELAPPFELGEMHVLVKRGRYFRSFVRHILIQHIGVQERQLSIRRTRPEAEELAKKILAETKRDGSNWDEMVRRYSDDLATVGLLGSIGSGTNGDFQHEIQQTVEDTPPGRVSDVITDADDGFHILWRVN